MQTGDGGTEARNRQSCENRFPWEVMFTHERITIARYSLEGLYLRVSLLPNVAVGASHGNCPRSSFV